MAAVRFDRSDAETGSDLELLLAASTDPEMYGRFYSRHVLDVLRFFQRRIYSPQEAADLTAETFARGLLLCRAHSTPIGSAKSWLFSIANHELAHYLRRAHVESHSLARIGVERIELDDLSFERIEALIDTESLRNDLNAALDRIPRKLSRAAWLRIGLELPYERVASELRCSEGAARVRVARALTKLADLMEERG